MKSRFRMTILKKENRRINLDQSLTSITK